MDTFSLDSIVDISVLVSPLAAPRATFNELLIVGPTAIIDTDERVRVYESVAELAADGFVATDPEHIAATLYFSQSPEPRKLWVGRQDTASSPEESFLEAITDCRDKEDSWYVGICLGSDKEDHIAIAAWAEATTPSTIYAFTTWDADVITSSPSPVGIFEYLKVLDYSRTIGQYATTQSDVYPNNIYAMVGVMGYVCGQNSGLANSSFTLKFKEETGIATEPLTSTQRGYIENQNGNIFLSYGNYYDWFEQGVMADGTFFDEKISLDMLVNDMQLAISDLLNSTPKIPQTDGGVGQMVHAINQTCENSVRLGFLAPGTWTGVDLLNLKTGDTLPNGYLVQAEALADQSTADRQLRKSVPLYVAIKEAGAVHSVVIGIYVDR